MSSDSQDLCLYTAHSPNGYKISITLEELGLPYQVVLVDMGKLAQKSPEFPAINPNGRIPALTDSSFGGISLFESGSIMQYLVDRYDPENKLSYARGTKEYYQTNNWVWLERLISIAILTNELTRSAILPKRWYWSYARPA